MGDWKKPMLATALLAGVALIAWPGAGARVGAKARSAPPQVPLGSEALCAAASGLPAGWGSDTRAGMAWVPDGDFVFGSTRGYPDERPASPRRQAMRGFWIDRTEVTNAQFERFVRATGYVTQAEREGAGVVFHQPGQAELDARPYAWWRYVRGANWRRPGGASGGNHGKTAGDNADGNAPAAPPPNQPVTLIAQADALAYARWLGRDLPTEAEWEYAAKAGRDDDALDAAPVDLDGKPTANFWQGPFPLADAARDGHAGLAPVGCYAANAFGLFDTIGNAWEWTKDPYTGSRQSHGNGDPAAVAAAGRANAPTVIKGGSFLCAPSYCVRYRAAARESQEADLGASHIGFRTVLRAP